MSQLFINVYFLLMPYAELFVVKNESKKVALVNWINELPTYRTDLKEYKDALKNILFYFRDNKNDMHASAVFGLRMTSENLKLCLASMGSSLSLADRAYISNAIDRIDDLIHYYKITFLDRLNPSTKTIMIGVVATGRPWTMRMKQFDLDFFKLNEGGRRSMQLSWEQYKAVNSDTNSSVPSLMLSDFCVNWMAEDTTFERTTYPQSCLLPSDCMEGLLNGTDYGPGLGYRILMLAVANVYQNCHIITWEEDRKLFKKLCQLAMREINYIVDHGYGESDKFLEYALLCATQGFTQFMKRSWIHRALKLQTVHGCFVTSSEQPIAVASRRKGRNYVRGDQHQVQLCHLTMTAAASSTLAAGIRLIMESYY